MSASLFMEAIKSLYWKIHAFTEKMGEKKVFVSSVTFSFCFFLFWEKKKNLRKELERRSIGIESNFGMWR